MTKTYQKSSEPTVEEMKAFAKRFNPEQWAKLIKNEVFVKNYDKDLNLLSVAAEMILNNRTVTSIKDVRARISS